MSLKFIMCTLTEKNICIFIATVTQKNHTLTVIFYLFKSYVKNFQTIQNNDK